MAQVKEAAQHASGAPQAATPAESSDAPPAFVTAGQEVTMRGDLEQITLSDIFQTLALSKMEGVLLVCNPLEQRALFFDDGHVRDLMFNRPTHRRIGSRLVNAGLITREQLQDVLEQQSRVPRPVGEILVEHGHLEQDQLDNIANYQAEEDLHALFTWRHGTFEFYKGRPADPRAVARLEAVPRFPVDRILLEVARRSDEWDQILETLHSVDDILRVCDGHDAGELDGDLAAVLHAVDGRRSIRELTQFTLLGVFHCAHVCKQLLHMGVVEPIDSQGLLDAAERQRKRGDVRRAVVTLRTLFDREDERLDLETTRTLAAALDRNGDSRLAGRCLWRAAEDPEHEEHALELLRQACRLDTRSSYLLLSLHRALERERIGGEELVDVTGRLAEALVEEERDDDAVAWIERLEAISDDRHAVLSRKARVLQKVGRFDEAVEILDDLAEHLLAQKKPSQLASVYEQILMLDSRRRDVQKALSRLRTSKRTLRLRRAALAAAVLLLAAGGYLYLRHRATVAEVERRVAELGGEIDAGRLDGLQQRIEAAVAELGEHDELLALDSRLRAQLASIASRRERERERQLRESLAAAADALEQGNVVRSLDGYGALLAQPGSRAQTLTVLKHRIKSLTSRLEDLAARLPSLVPEPPSDLQTEQQRAEVLAALDLHFKPLDRELALGVQLARDHPVLLDVLDPKQRDALVTNARGIERAFVRGRRRQEEYLAAERRATTKQQLQPLFLAAQRHEAEHRFAEALAAYRALVAGYPVESPLKADFRAKVERYAWIQAKLDALAAATAAGDAAAARQRLSELAAREPQVPFDRLVRLPIRIESTPPGAVAMVNGEAVGRTPLRTSYVARGPTVIRVHLPGFLTQQRTLDDGFDGRSHMLLTKAPDWANVAPGSVQCQPVCDDQGQAFVVDRSGTVSSFGLDDGDVDWSHATGDLSGLLPRPVLHGQQLLVSSFDGRLRSLDRATGAELWHRDGLPCEGAPVVVGGTLVAATVEREVVGLDVATGQPRYRTGLPGPVRTDVVAVGQHVYAVTDDGWLLCVHALKGEIVWSRRVAERVAAGPAAAPGVVLVASDDGTLAALASDDGRPLWQRSGLGELTLRPAVVGGQVVVAAGMAVHSFQLTDGQRGPRYRGDAVWTAAPVAAHDKLFLGDQSGIVHVLDPATLRCRYLLRGKGRISAPVAMDGAGRAIAGFESKVLQGFRRLP